MSVKTLTFTAAKGGTIDYQNSKFEEAKKEWSKVLADAVTVFSSQIVEREGEYQFIAVIEDGKKEKKSKAKKEKKFKLSSKKGRE